MSILNKSSEYGLRAAVYVAAHGEGRHYVPIHEIASELNISFHFLTKILQVLSDHGIMTSYRGPHGGVALARPAAKISLRHITEALEGSELFHECILGLTGCGNDRPCPLHAKWGPLRAELAEILDGQSIASLAAQLDDKAIRISDRRVTSRRGPTRKDADGSASRRGTSGSSSVPAAKREKAPRSRRAR